MNELTKNRSATNISDKEDCSSFNKNIYEEYHQAKKICSKNGFANKYSSILLDQICDMEGTIGEKDWNRILYIVLTMYGMDRR